jgi:hypothetical protein
LSRSWIVATLVAVVSRFVVTSVRLVTSAFLLGRSPYFRAPRVCRYRNMLLVYFLTFLEGIAQAIISFKLGRFSLIQQKTHVTFPVRSPLKFVFMPVNNFMSLVVAC